MFELESEGLNFQVNVMLQDWVMMLMNCFLVVLDAGLLLFMVV
jgi:hypothetical protein